MLVQGLLLINFKIVICYFLDKECLLAWLACVPLSIHQLARKAPAFRPGMDSAESEGLLLCR